MTSNSPSEEKLPLIKSVQHPQTVVYNPSLNSIIYLNDQQEFLVRSADQFSTLFHRTCPITNLQESSSEIISCHDKFIFLTSTHIYVRQLYQGLYFLDSIVSSINDENCHVLIELTYGDAQLLLQLLSTLELSALNHIGEFYEILKQKFDEHTSSSLWNLIQFSYDCLNAIKACFDVLRLHRQQIQAGSNSQSSLPGIVVVGLLLDYLTRYYHHKKSITTNTEEQIGSTVETSSSSSTITTTTTTAMTATPSTSSTSTTTSLFNTGGRPTRERLMFSEATRYRTFTHWPHAAFRWLSPVSHSMQKISFVLFSFV